MTAIVTKIPALRFPEFEGEWVKLKIKDVGQIRSGSTPLRSKKQYFQDGLISWVKTTDLNNSYIYQTEENVTERALKETSLKLFAPGSVLVAMYGGFNQIGRTGLLKVEAATNQALSVISVNEVVIPEYLLSWFNAKVRLWKRFAGSSRKDPNITGSDVANFPVWLPPKVEQQKIATFLTTIDARIQQLRRKKALLEQYKKGVMQQIFSQEIRFKDEEGKEFPAWEYRRLSSVLNEHGLKSNDVEEVYSVSVHKGVINQKEHLGRSFAAATTSHYNLVKPHDIIYTKSPTGDFPLGIIKQSRVDRNVIVSPLYGVFTPETPALGYILNDYFAYSANTHNYLQSIIQKGAKNTINITNKTFLSKSLRLPVSKEEQQKIAAFLSSIDRQINLATQQLNRMQTFKKGLLQQMFV